MLWPSLYFTASVRLRNLACNLMSLALWYIAFRGLQAATSRSGRQYNTG